MSDILLVVSGKEVTTKMCIYIIIEQIKLIKHLILQSYSKTGMKV